MLLARYNINVAWLVGLEIDWHVIVQWRLHNQSLDSISLFYLLPAYFVLRLLAQAFEFGSPIINLEHVLFWVDRGSLIDRIFAEVMHPGPPSAHLRLRWEWSQFLLSLRWARRYLDIINVLRRINNVEVDVLRGRHLRHHRRQLPFHALSRSIISNL